MTDNIEFNANRIRLTQVFQHRPYQSMTMDVTLECTLHDGNEEAVIEQGITTIQRGFGKALIAILKRYNENKSNTVLNAELNKIIPAALRETLMNNEFIVDCLYLAVQDELEKDPS